MAKNFRWPKLGIPAGMSGKDIFSGFLPGTDIILDSVLYDCSILQNVYLITGTSQPLSTI